MEDINMFINWLMQSFLSLYNFFVNQHPIVQAAVFMPIAVMIISLIFLCFKTLFNGRSLG